jgi:hypothetical protein
MSTERTSHGPFGGSHPRIVWSLMLSFSALTVGTALLTMSWLHMRNIAVEAPLVMVIVGALTAVILRRPAGGSAQIALGLLRWVAMPTVVISAGALVMSQVPTSHLHGVVSKPRALALLIVGCVSLLISRRLASRSIGHS